MSDTRGGTKKKKVFLANIYERNCPKKNFELFGDTEHERGVLYIDAGMLYIRFPGYCMVAYSKRVCSCDTCTRYVLCTPMGSWVIKMTAITSTFRKHLLDSVGYGNPYQLVVVSGHEKTRSELLSMPPGIESSFSRTRICALERAVTNASSGTCGDTIPTQTKLLP